jgi:hypothetical protein
MGSGVVQISPDAALCQGEILSMCVMLGSQVQFVDH